jgi:hypothetical protein
MTFLEPLVAAVGVDVGAFRQRRPASTNFEIVNPVRRGPGDAGDATVLRNGEFGLDGVTFLLVGIPATLFSAKVH